MAPQDTVEQPCAEVLKASQGRLMEEAATTVTLMRLHPEFCPINMHPPKRRRLHGKQHSVSNSHGTQEIPGGPSSSFGSGVSQAGRSADIPSIRFGLVTKRYIRKQKQSDPTRSTGASR